jgi:hypothetical protein
MASATRVACDKEGDGDGGKSDGYEGDKQATATRLMAKRVMATAKVTMATAAVAAAVVATATAMVTVTAVATSTEPGISKGYEGEASNSKSE